MEKEQQLTNKELDEVNGVNKTFYISHLFSYDEESEKQFIKEQLAKPKHKTQVTQ